MNKYKTLIIGLGQIGMEYDYNQNKESRLLVLSHAQAIFTHPKFELAGGVDISNTRRDAFRKKFKKPCFENLNLAFKADSFDVVVISTNTQSHFETFKAVLEHSKPKLIVLEKPLAYTVSESRAIIELGSKVGVPVAVNYFRAYEPSYQHLREQLEEGLLGFPLTSIVRYTNGMVNNGSHWVQFLLPVFGNFQRVGFSSISPTFEGDIVGDLQLIFERGTAYFISFEQTEYYLFEIDIYGPLGKITIDGGGNRVSEYFTTVDPAFPAAKALVEKPKITEINISQYQSFVYNNIQEFLDGKATLSCCLETLVDLIKVYSEIEKILEVKKYVK